MNGNQWYGSSDPALAEGLKEIVEQLPELPLGKLIKKSVQGVSSLSAALQERLQERLQEHSTEPASHGQKTPISR